MKLSEGRRVGSGVYRTDVLTEETPEVRVRRGKAGKNTARGGSLPAKERNLTN